MNRPPITPGDWKTVGELDTLAVIAESDDPRACDGQTQICQVRVGDYEITHYEIPAANAQAIAALPKLLDALEAVHQAVRQCPEYGEFITLPDGRSVQPMALVKHALLAAGYTE